MLDPDARLDVGALLAVGALPAFGPGPGLYARLDVRPRLPGDGRRLTFGAPALGLDTRRSLPPISPLLDAPAASRLGAAP